MASLSIASAKEVFDLVQGDLRLVEREFAVQAESEVQDINEIGEYLLAVGGKRIRPLLLLLSAKSLGFDGESRIRMGAVV